MSDLNDLVSLIKQASKEMTDSMKPCDFLFGVVISADPLKIQVEQKITLNKNQLMLSRNVTDYETEITISGDYGWITEDTQNGVKLQSLSLAQNHKHDIKLDKKKIKIHNALKKDEKVILLRAGGGQKYLVIDRVVKL